MPDSKPPVAETQERGYWNCALARPSEAGQHYCKKKWVRVVSWNTEALGCPCQYWSRKDDDGE